MTASRAAARAAALAAVRAAGLCEWFARCTRPAVALVSHPILGSVPTCQQCIDRFDMADRIVGEGSPQ